MISGGLEVQQEVQVGLSRYQRDAGNSVVEPLRVLVGCLPAPALLHEGFEDVLRLILKCVHRPGFEGRPPFTRNMTFLKPSVERLQSE